MTWPRRLHPALFAAAPVLALAARNPGRFITRDALVLAFGAVLATAASYALFEVLVRAVWSRRARRSGHVDRDQVRDVAALLTLGAVALCYLFPVYRSAVACASDVSGCLYERVVAYPSLHAVSHDAKRWLHDHRVVGALIALVGAGLAAALAVAGIRRASRAMQGGGMLQRVTLGGAGRFLTLAGALLVAFSLVQLAYTPLARSRAMARSALVRELARPLPASAARADAHGPKRDVYVLILDGYPSADVLRERFGYDNRPFEDSLRALGFRIPAVRSNYSVTLLSVGSLLNFAHVHSLVDVVDARSKDYGPAAEVLQRNRLVRFLKARGYHFVFFPAKAYAPTEDNPLADEVYQASHGVDLSRALYRSELALEVVTNSVLDPARRFLRPYATLRTAFATETFAGLSALPPRAEPTLAIAHVLMPHMPFVADAMCRPRAEPSWAREALAGQMECVNRMTLRTIRALIARSRVPPIIMIQGDHGSESLHPFDTPPTQLSVDQARERFRPFGAYYLPNGGASAIPDSLSIVNVMRYVLDYYYGTALPPLPNTMYFSSWRLPYDMVEVGDDFRVTASARRAAKKRWVAAGGPEP